MPRSSKEVMASTLDLLPVGPLPFVDSFWGDTYRRYVAEGHLAEGECVVKHFGMAMRRSGWINFVADLDAKEEILEETEDTKTVRTGNRAILRWHKKHTGTPEHIGFEVTDREGWERFARPRLVGFDRRRMNADSYRESRATARVEGEYFAWSGVAPFEQIHPLCGHEHMLLGMALDPDWITDMVDVYSDLTLRHLEVLFEEEGLPDALFFYEDMGFKERPFMSPTMYEELIQPGHAKLCGWAHERGLKVIIHSCGFVDPLVPGMIDAGMDCLQAMEVKAGMDLPDLARRFGDRISFMGGFDVRALITNDRAKIDAEFERAIVPVLSSGRAYTLHSDHSIPPEVDYDTLRYFIDRGKELATKYLTE